LPQCTLRFFPGVEPSGMQKSRRGLTLCSWNSDRTFCAPKRAFEPAAMLVLGLSTIRRCSSSSTRHPLPHATDHSDPPHARLTVVDMLFHNQKSTHAVETLFGYAGFRV